METVWEGIRQAEEAAALTLDDGVVVVGSSGGQSPYDVSAERESVWFTGCTNVSRNATFLCLTSEMTQRAER